MRLDVGRANNYYWLSNRRRPAISADLGPNLEAVVEDLVKNGRYNSKSEVLREGVRLVQEREAELAEFYASLDRGIADAKAGRSKPAEEVFARLIAKYEAMIDADDEQAPRRRHR